MSLTLNVDKPNFCPADTSEIQAFPHPLSTTGSPFHTDHSNGRYSIYYLTSEATRLVLPPSVFAPVIPIL